MSESAEGQVARTRLGWIVGGAAAIFGVLFWCANAWLLSSDGAVYAVMSLLAPGALALAVACFLLPGPRFELTREDASQIGALVLREGRWWQLLLWGVALVAGAVAGAMVPERVFAPWSH